MLSVTHPSLLPLVQLLPENPQGLKEAKGFSFRDIYHIHYSAHDWNVSRNVWISRVISVVAIIAQVAAVVFAALSLHVGLLLAVPLAVGSVPVGILVGMGCYQLLKRVTPQNQLKSILDHQLKPILDILKIAQNFDDDSLLILDREKLKKLFVNTTSNCLKKMLKKANLQQLHTYMSQVSLRDSRRVIEKCDSPSLNLLKFIDRVAQLKEPVEIREILQCEPSREAIRQLPLFYGLLEQRLQSSPEHYASMKDALAGEEVIIQLGHINEMIRIRKACWSDYSEKLLKTKDGANGIKILDIASEDHESFNRFIDRINGKELTTNRVSFIGDLTFAKKYGLVKVFNLMEDDLKDVFEQFTLMELIDLCAKHKHFEPLQQLALARVKLLFQSGGMSLKEAWTAAETMQSDALKDFCLKGAKNFIRFDNKFTHSRKNPHMYDLYQEAYESLDKDRFAIYVKHIIKRGFDYNNNINMLHDFILARIQEGKIELQPLIVLFS